MLKTEKQILLDVVSSLHSSTFTTWSTGTLDDWIIYAKKMRITIDSVVPIIRTIANYPDETNSEFVYSDFKRNDEIFKKNFNKLMKNKDFNAFERDFPTLLDVIRTSMEEISKKNVKE
jgi:hypothetical protein